MHVAAPTLRVLLRFIVKHATLRPLLIAGTAMVALQYTFLAHVVLFLTNQLKIPLIDAEFLLALVQFIGIIGRAFRLGSPIKFGRTSDCVPSNGRCWHALPA